MISAVSWNKLKLEFCKRVYFPRDGGLQKEIKQFSNIIYLCFLAEEVVLQICHCVHGPFLLWLENANLNKI